MFIRPRDWRLGQSKGELGLKPIDLIQARKALGACVIVCNPMYMNRKEILYFNYSGCLCNYVCVLYAYVRKKCIA
jgi:hypothetical protein